MKPYLVEAKRIPKNIGIADKRSSYNLLQGRTSLILRLEIQSTLKRTVNGNRAAVVLHRQNSTEVTAGAC